MNAQLPARPSTSAAIAYVRDHFAAGYAVPIHVVGCVPCPAEPQARDVLFVMGDNPRPLRMAVWFEQSGDAPAYLYGEW